MEMFDEDYCIFDENDRSQKELSRELPPPPTPNRHPIHKSVVSEESTKQEEYKFPVEKGIMVFDTEFADSHLLQLSYIIVYSDTRKNRVVNKFFPYPKKSEIKSILTFYAAIHENGFTEDFVDSRKPHDDKEEAVKEFLNDIESVDIVFAHNAGIDQRVISAEASRYGLNIKEDVWNKLFCTQHNIEPNDYYNKGLKALAEKCDVEYPELYYQGKKYKDSLLDCKVTLECIKKLYERGCLFSPDGRLLKRPIKSKTAKNSTPKTKDLSELRISGKEVLNGNDFFNGKKVVITCINKEEDGMSKDELKDVIGKKANGRTTEDVLKKSKNLKGERNADVLIVGSDLFIDGVANSKATKKGGDALTLQQQNDEGFLVVSAKAVVEYLKEHGY